MAPQQRDPFGNFERVRRQIDELFGDMWTRTGLSHPRRAGFTPRVDVYYCGDPPKAVIKADLAAIDSENLNIEVRGRLLVISGQRKAQDTEGRVYQQIEIEHGAFHRAIELGVDVDAGAARASYENGILRVELPVVQPGEARQVPISSRSAGAKGERE
jgi:HSP20 family protein